MLEQYDLHNLMVLDIETVPQYSTHDQVPEYQSAYLQTVKGQA